MCAAIAVCGTELFTSPSFSYWLCFHFSFLTQSFFPCLPNFLSILLLSHFVSILLRHVLNSLCLHLLLLLTPPPPLHSRFCFFSSPVLSALRHVSAITPLHLLIPVLIQPSTHTHTYGATSHIRLPFSHTCTYACQLHKNPRGCKKPSVFTQSQQLTVQENALCKRTGSINLPAGSDCSLMLFFMLCFFLTCMWLYFIAVTIDLML